MCPGLGYCLTFLPTITILSQYFNRRRSLVTALASSGESFAMFVFAPGTLRFHVCPKLHPIPYIVHYFGPGSNDTLFPT